MWADQLGKRFRNQSESLLNHFRITSEFPKLLRFVYFFIKLFSLARKSTV